LNQNVYYRWSKKFLEAGKQKLSGNTRREATSDEIGELRKENNQLKQVLADTVLKNVVKLEHYYSPWELERAIEAFVQYYNQDRYHESLDNVTPADMYFGRYHEIINQRAQIKQQTLQLRRYQNLNSVPAINQAI
jgi:transposase InsO family protein